MIRNTRFLRSVTVLSGEREHITYNLRFEIKLWKIINIYNFKIRVQIVFNSLWWLINLRGNASSLKYVSACTRYKQVCQDPCLQEYKCLSQWLPAGKHEQTRRLKKKKDSCVCRRFFSLFDKSLGGRFNPRSKVMIDWCGRIGELGL